MWLLEAKPRVCFYERKQKSHVHIYMRLAVKTFRWISSPKTVVRPKDKADREPQSRKIIEVACDVKLREQYQLQDGDVIEVEVED